MSLSQLTFLDWAFLVVILTSTGFALTKGLVRELIRLAALIGGFILAVFYYPALGGRFSSWTRTDAIASLVAFVVIFVGTLLLSRRPHIVASQSVREDGVARMGRPSARRAVRVSAGWAVCSIIVLAMVAFPVRDNEALAKSVLAPFMLAGARAVVIAVPQDLKNQFEEGYKKVISILVQNKKAKYFKSFNLRQFGHASVNSAPATSPPPFFEILCFLP